MLERSVTNFDRVLSLAKLIIKKQDELDRLKGDLSDLLWNRSKPANKVSHKKNSFIRGSVSESVFNIVNDHPVLTFSAGDFKKPLFGYDLSNRKPIVIISILHRLCKSGRITRVSRGKYRARLREDKDGT